MGFQSTVYLAQGAGVPGEIYLNTPMRAQSYILDSAGPNPFAYAYSITAQGHVQVGNPGGTSVFAGIMVNPKGSASFGGSGGPLTPTLDLSQYSQAEIASMGTFFVTLPGAANIGDIVIYDETTGALATIAPGVSLPSGKLYANAYVDVFTLSGAGLGVITLNPVTPAVVQ